MDKGTLCKVDCLCPQEIVGFWSVTVVFIIVAFFFNVPITVEHLPHLLHSQTWDVICRRMDPRAEVSPRMWDLVYRKGKVIARIVRCSDAPRDPMLPQRSHQGLHSAYRAQKAHLERPRKFMLSFPGKCSVCPDLKARVSQFPHQGQTQYQLDQLPFPQSRGCFLENDRQ